VGEGVGVKTASKEKNNSFKRKKKKKEKTVGCFLATDGDKPTTSDSTTVCGLDLRGKTPRNKY
jgi:hypothetical protein